MPDERHTHCMDGIASPGEKPSGGSPEYHSSHPLEPLKRVKATAMMIVPQRWEKFSIAEAIY